MQPAFAAGQIALTNFQSRAAAAVSREARPGNAAPLADTPLTCYRDRWRCALFDLGPLVFLGVSTAVRLLAGFVLLKYLALQFGPGSFGLLTQVMGVAAIFYTFAGGGITTGLIRNIATTQSEEEHQRWMSAGTTINLLSSLVLGGVAIALALLDGSVTFGDPSYGSAYIVIAVAQIIVGLGNIALAYLAATGRTRTFASVHIAGNILSLLLLILLVQILGFNGALFALVFAPAVTGSIALWQFLRRGGHPSILRISWEPPLLNNLFSYAAAMACGVTAVPLAQLLIRLSMGENLGWSFVGYWQAVVKISDAYMLFIGVIFINYLLPQLSQRHEDSSALRALVRFGVPLLGIFSLAGAVIYLARDYVILIVYSAAFSPAESLVLPQLTGDMLRIAALLPYYYFMSRRRIRMTIVLDLMQGFGLYVFYFLLAPSYGALAPVYSHILSCALMLIFGLSPIALDWFNSKTRKP